MPCHGIFFHVMCLIFWDQQWFIDFEHGFGQLELLNATSCEGLKEKNKKDAFHHPYYK